MVNRTSFLHTISIILLLLFTLPAQCATPTLCIGALLPGGTSSHLTAVRLAVSRVTSDPFVLPNVDIKVHASTATHVTDLVTASSVFAGNASKGAFKRYDPRRTIPVAPAARRGGRGVVGVPRRFHGRSTLTSMFGEEVVTIMEGDTSVPAGNAPCVAIVGPRNSEESGYVKVATDKLGIPLVSYFATSANLVEEGSLFSRIAPSDQRRALAILSFLKEKTYMKVGCVYSPGEFGSGLYMTMMNKASSFGVHIGMGFDVRGNLTASFAEAKDTGIKVFIASLSSSHVDTLFNAAEAAGMLSPNIVWITTDAVQEIVARPASTLIGRRRVGWLAALPIIHAGSATDDFSSLWASLDPTEYPGAGPGTTPEQIDMLIYDATYSVLRAAHSMRFSTATTFTTALRELNYVGATGDIRFDSLGDRLMPIDIVNVRDGSQLVTVASMAVASETVIDVAPIVWQSSEMPQVSSVIRGRKFRAAIKISPPFQILEEDEDGNKKWSGFMIDLIDHISAELGCTFELIHVPDLTYTAMVEAIARGEYDLAMADITVTNSRVKMTRFTHATVQSSLGIAVLKTVAEDSYFKFIEPFQGEVWLCFLLSLILGAVVIVYLERDAKGSPIPDDSFKSAYAEAFWYCASAITFSQQNDLASIPGRIFAWAFLFFLFLITSFFTANLTANLTIQRLETSINSISDLTSKPTAVLGGTSTEEYLRTIQLQSLVTTSSSPELITLLRDKSVVAFVDDRTLMSYSLRNACDIVIAGQPFYASLWGWPVAPHFEFLEEINNVLSAGWDSGFLTEELLNKWVPSSDARCADGDSATADGLPIGDFAGIYIVLGFAALMSTAITAVQRWRKRGKTDDGNGNNNTSDSNNYADGDDKNNPPSVEKGIDIAIDDDGNDDDDRRRRDNGIIRPKRLVDNVDFDASQRRRRNDARDEPWLTKERRQNIGKNDNPDSDINDDTSFGYSNEDDTGNGDMQRRREWGL